MEKIIEALLSMGYAIAGHTRQETVRMPDSRVPIGNRGKSGGKVATFGGRLKMWHRDDQFVTIGPRTVFFWRKDGERFADQCRFSAKEYDKIVAEASRRIAEPEHSYPDFQDPVKAARFDLWSFFQEEHNLTLLESDLDEICRRVGDYLCTAYDEEELS